MSLLSFSITLNTQTIMRQLYHMVLDMEDIECIIALGITQLQYYAYAQLINQNKIDTVINTLPDKASKTAMTELINAIKDMTLSESLLAGGPEIFHNVFAGSTVCPCV